MNIETMFPKRWLAADDFGGRQVTVEVTAVTIEQVRNPQTKQEGPKLAVAFVGKQKRLLLNKTQAYQFAALAGSKETGDWVGLRVTLAAAPAPNGHQTIAVSRPPVRTVDQNTGEIQEPAPAPEPVAPVQDDNPFEELAP